MMRKLSIIAAVISAVTCLSGCQETYNNPSFGEKDIPAIFVTWNSKIAMNLGDTIKISPQISPADGATFRWTLDDAEISAQKDLVYKITSQGDFTLKLTVTRNGVENSRTASVLVIKPFIPKDYKKMMVGYLSRNGKESDVKWDQITHLIISSAIVNDAATAVDTNFKDAGLDVKTLATIAHNNNVYVLLDVTGKIDYANATGPYAESGFYNTAIDPVARQKLIADVLKFVKDNGLDGVNIYLNNTSLSDAFGNPAAVTDFFNEFAAALPAAGPNGKFFFTASVPMGWTTGALSMVAGINRFDWYNLMAIGASDITPVHHASFWAFTNLAETWKAYGIAPEKMVMAVPSFGVHYTFPDGVSIDWGNAWMYTSWKSYRDILALDPNAETKNKLEMDKGIFYDGFNDIAAKAKYVTDENLGGLSIWSIEQDSKEDGKSLTKKANSSLGN